MISLRYLLKWMPVFVHPGQVWGHTSEERLAASALGRYSFGFRLAIVSETPGPPSSVYPLLIQNNSAKQTVRSSLNEYMLLSGRFSAYVHFYLCSSEVL